MIKRKQFLNLKGNSKRSKLTQSNINRCVIFRQWPTFQAEIFYLSLWIWLIMFFLIDESLMDKSILAWFIHKIIFYDLSSTRDLWSAGVIESRVTGKMIFSIQLQLDSPNNPAVSSTWTIIGYYPLVCSWVATLTNLLFVCCLKVWIFQVRKGI